jgi:DNA-directed RNA polymerase subunit RPC12/RpoP
LRIYTRASAAAQSLLRDSIMISEKDRDSDASAGTSEPETIACPYCGTRLRWSAHEWAGRGTYKCAQCGEFPDFTVRADEARTGSDKE